MTRCKHWHDGKCKDCTKNCPIKARLTREAARKAGKPSETRLEISETPPSLAEALAHGDRVAQLAEKILDCMASAYSITSPWPAVLRTAARLHDVGWVYGQKAHHKTSARMIRSGSIDEVEKDIRPLVALVARYHRRTDPSTRQRRFAELSSTERRGVRRIAALLRLADALDYSHAGLVADVDAMLGEEALHLTLNCPQGCEAEVGRVAAKKGLFQKVFKKDVLCQCKTQETPMTNPLDKPDTTASVPPTAMETATPEK